VVPIYDQFGQVSGYQTELDYECIRSLNLRVFKTIVEQNCIKFSNAPFLIQCIDFTGRALYNLAGVLYYGFSNSCVSSNNNQGVWTDNPVEFKLLEFPVNQYNNLPQIGSKCSKFSSYPINSTITNTNYHYYTTVDASNCGNKTPCSQLRKISCV
jgi:hypothetical protein